MKRKQRQNKKLGMEAEWDLRVTVGSERLEAESIAIGLAW